MKKIVVVSLSGGKDSTAVALLALERYKREELRFVFSDTGHEHEETYKYLDYLTAKLDIEITKIKADFSERIENKREYIKKRWKNDLTKEGKGYWKVKKKYKDLELKPPEPYNPALHHKKETEYFKWVDAHRPMTEEEAETRIKEALEYLKPTGNPFLDLCLWKGRFPAKQVRFCTEELKKKPLMDYQEHLLFNEGFDRVEIWVGVRKDESPSRQKITSKWQCEFGNQNETTPEESEGIWLHLPILDWTVDQVFNIMKKYDVEPNPLYKKGMGRVGCMPCVMCNKRELKEIANRFPCVEEKLQKWEVLVSKVAKRGKATFFNTNDICGIKNPADVDIHEHGIKAAMEWARTSRGGRQYDLLDDLEKENTTCSSIYGLCE